MARRYVRDNRGRFASSGAGATARGGRLKTASGGKREGKTMKAAARMSPSGAIRATDVNKARVHNAVSKIVQANQAKGRYDQNTYRAEGKVSRLIAAEKRVKSQKRATPPSRQMDLAQGNLKVSQERLKAARKMAKNATGPIEKLRAQSRVNEASLNAKKARDAVTLIKAEPRAGRPINGRDRWGVSMRAGKANRPAAVSGRVKRDPSARSKAPAGLNMNAGQYRRVYAMNANKAAAAANKRRR